nr:MAG: hypothetical protein [Microviridae sp.]
MKIIYIKLSDAQKVQKIAKEHYVNIHRAQKTWHKSTHNLQPFYMDTPWEEYIPICLGSLIRNKIEFIY